MTDLSEPDSTSAAEVLSKAAAAEVAEAVAELRKQERDQWVQRHQEFLREPGFAARLRQAAEMFLTPHPLTAGEYVQWKPGMKNRRFPEYGEPTVVIEVLDAPVQVEQTPDDEDLAEHLDLRLGLLLRDSRFVVFHFDRRRFEPYAEPI